MTTSHTEAASKQPRHCDGRFSSFASPEGDAKLDAVPVSPSRELEGRWSANPRPADADPITVPCAPTIALVDDETAVCPLCRGSKVTSTAWELDGGEVCYLCAGTGVVPVVMARRFVADVHRTFGPLENGPDFEQMSDDRVEHLYGHRAEVAEWAGDDNPV